MHTLIIHFFIYSLSLYASEELINKNDEQRRSNPPGLLISLLTLEEEGTEKYTQEAKGCYGFFNGILTKLAILVSSIYKHHFTPPGVLPIKSGHIE